MGLGITPGFGGTQRLARLVGMGMAKQLVYSAPEHQGRRGPAHWSGQRRLHAGGADARCAEAGRQDRQECPIAVRNCKKAINDGISLPIEKAVEVEEKLFGDCFETHDQVEGMGCFLSREKPKPKPVFTNN